MNRIVRSSLLACTILSNIAVANNIDVGKTYLKVGVGISNYENNEGFSHNNTGDTVTLKYNWDNTTAYKIGMGYKVNKYFTTELIYQRNNTTKLEGDFYLNGVYDNDRGTTYIKIESIRINALLDIKAILNKSWKISPYIGIGIGYAKNKHSDTTWKSSTDKVLGDVDISTLYSAIVGATYPISKKFFIDTAYSYTDYGTAQSSRLVEDNSGAAIGSIDEPFKVDIKSQELFVSLRYVF